MGDVYRGTDLRTGQPVAIKALRPEVVSSDSNALARFLREGEALRQLNHPNIVTIYSVEDDSDVPFFTMEYLEGTTLSHNIPKQGLDAARRPGHLLEDLVGDFLVASVDLRPGFFAEDEPASLDVDRLGARGQQRHGCQKSEPAGAAWT